MMHFPGYMGTTFLGLQLGPDLFRRWPIGIRFELHPDPGSRTSWKSWHWEAIHQRATTLYEAVFRPGDEAFVISGNDFETVRGGRKVSKLPKPKNSIFAPSQRSALGLGGVAGRQRLTTFYRDGTCLVSTYRWARAKPLEIGYKEILKAVMHRDFPPKRPGSLKIFTL